MHDDELNQVYGLIARKLLRGKVVPVLGAGVNLSERPPEAHWQRGTYLPSAAELADELAVEYPMINSRDLAQVAQYIVSQDGAGPLYEELHAVFDADYPPTRLHRTLACVARHLRLSGESRECLLCITTNYDDSLERAFAEIDEPFDVVTYLADAPDRGRFRHTDPNGRSVVIDKPNEYVDVRLDTRTVIAKVHGAVDRGAVDRTQQQDSFVITEDHYIDYITRADFSGLFPVTLAAKLRTSHLLFLGYSLRDWNLRVMLYRLWGEQGVRNFKSWAIQADPSPIDRAAWDDRGVQILPVRVESFVAAIREWMPREEVEVA